MNALYTITEKAYVSHFTTYIKCFPLLHWAWQKGLTDTLKEFRFSAPVVDYF